MFKKMNFGKKNGKFCFLLYFIPLLFCLFINMSKETDIWFLLSYGRYVLSHGFPIHDILSMHSDFSFVMQQWLTAVVFYITYSKGGEIALFLLVYFINILLLFGLYKLCYLVGKNRIISIIFSILIDLLMISNFIVPRPQIFSLLIFIWLLYILESYLKKDTKLIYFIPILSILLINLHASMWLFFFVLFMPFFVEFAYLFYKKKDKRIFRLLIVFVISLLVGFINPYGFSNMTYVFSSYGVSYINEIINEMKSISLIGDKFIVYNSCLILSVLVLILIVMAIRFMDKRFSIHQFLLLAGTLFMACCNIRNMAIFFICSIPFVADSFPDLKVKKIIGNKITIGVGAILLCVLGGLFYLEASHNIYALSNSNDKIVEYFKKNNVSKNVKLFTHYNDGSYYEYFGYHPYIDSRAEIFLKANNKKEDVFVEYYNLTNGKLNLEKFLKKYDFDYLVVLGNESLFHKLNNSDNYNLVLSHNGKYLFRKN